MTANTRPRRDGGYALVAVLWLITLLTILTASYHASARREARVFADTVYEAQARARAEAAVWIAVSDVGRSGRRDIPARTTRTVVFDGESIAVTLVEATGKVNLNQAGDDVLNRLLARTALAAGERSALVDAILDWRDGDSTRRPAGAEDDDYATVGHGSNDTPFATVDEVRHVRGMTDAVFRAIEGTLTVHGDHSRVSAEAAGADVLRSLSESDETTIDAYLRARERANTNDPPRLDGALGGLVPRVRGDIYTVTSSADARGFAATVEATLRIAQRGRDSVTVFEWK